MESLFGHSNFPSAKVTEGEQKNLRAGRLDENLQSLVSVCGLLCASWPESHSNCPLPRAVGLCSCPLPVPPRFFAHQEWSRSLGRVAVLESSNKLSLSFPYRVCVQMCECATVCFSAVVDTQKETGRESKIIRARKTSGRKATLARCQVTVCVSVCVSALSCGCDAGAVGAAETNDLCTVTSAMHLLHTEQQ